MSLIPLSPLFHCLNRDHFDGVLTWGDKPLVNVRWSDGRLRKTAGFYRRSTNIVGLRHSEIVLSRPLLANLPASAVESTLCHEMIHAWTDLVLKVPEGHGPNFLARMSAINESQERFQVTVKHTFPVPLTTPKWWAVCPRCGLRSPYKRIVRGVACRMCCNLLYGGEWHESCLLVYQAALKK